MLKASDLKACKPIINLLPMPTKIFIKKVVLLYVSFLFQNYCLSQSQLAYNRYLNNLCTCFGKDTANVNSSDYAIVALGKCINSVDTTLRNKAMIENRIFKTDVESLIRFEKIFGADLLKKCTSFKLTIEKVAKKQPYNHVANLPILDTISENICGCLQSKGVSNSKSTVINNINDCFTTSISNRLEELIRYYHIPDDNQELLPEIGKKVTELIQTNCRFYVEKLIPILQKN